MYYKSEEGYLINNKQFTNTEYTQTRVTYEPEPIMPEGGGGGPIPSMRITESEEPEPPMPEGGGGGPIPSMRTLSQPEDQDDNPPDFLPEGPGGRP